MPEAIGRKIIQCQPHMQQKPNTTLRNLLKRKTAKIRKLSELSKTEQIRLAKLNRALDELRRGKGDILVTLWSLLAVTLGYIWLNEKV